MRLSRNYWSLYVPQRGKTYGGNFIWRYCSGGVTLQKMSRVNLVGHKILIVEASVVRVNQMKTDLVHYYQRTFFLDN